MTLILLLFATIGLKAQPGVATLANEAAFEAAIKNNERVVVIFAAEWCDYCKAFLPQVEGMVRDYKEVKFFRINYDENRDFFVSEGIKMTPTTRLYKDGEKAGEMVVLQAAPLQEKLHDF